MTVVWNLLGIVLFAQGKYSVACLFTAFFSLVILGPHLNRTDPSNDFYLEANWAGKLVLAFLAFNMVWAIVTGFDFGLGYFLGQAIN